MRLEISFLLLWNRRSAFLQYCTLLFRKLGFFDCPSDMVGQIWHVPTVQVDMFVVMYNVHTSTGTGHGLVAPLALCLGPPRKNFSKICPIPSYGIYAIKKSLEQIFFGCGKMFVMPGVGPRPACHIPEPRDSWQQCTLWFSHVIVSLPVNPGLQWYLKIGFC